MLIHFAPRPASLPSSSVHVLTHVLLHVAHYILTRSHTFSSTHSLRSLHLITCKELTHLGRSSPSTTPVFTVSSTRSALEHSFQHVYQHATQHISFRSKTFWSTLVYIYLPTLLMACLGLRPLSLSTHISPLSPHIPQYIDNVYQNTYFYCFFHINSLVTNIFLYTFFISL